ncbi:hypothetical protein ACJJTC_010617 [Scirpophaga incertulas]
MANFIIEYSAIMLCLLLRTEAIESACSFTVHLSQILHNEGFHRNITYEIVFDSDEVNDWIKHDCLIALDQTLPAGVYANPDELSDFRRSNKLNAIPKNRINVELPAEQSDESSVYIINMVSEDKVNLWLPVHSRYHQAVRGGGYARNRIGPPKIYLRCPDLNLDACGSKITPFVTFLCNGGREKCGWKEITYTMTTDSLIWDVPVGNLDHYYFVAAGDSWCHRCRIPVSIESAPRIQNQKQQGKETVITRHYLCSYIN